MSVTRAQLKSIAMSFPGALEKSSYGKPSFFILKKFFTRLRSEDDSIVLLVDSIDERDMLLEADPKTYFITEHYRDYPAVLARRTEIDPKTLKARLERRWQKLYPKKLAKELVEKKLVERNKLSSPRKRAPGKRASAR